MDQAAIELYHEKIKRRNELNRLKGLIEGEHYGSARQLADWNYEFALNWQWFTDHRIALPETPLGKYDFTRTPAERAYEQAQASELQWNDLEVKLERKKKDFLSTTEYLAKVLVEAHGIVANNEVELLNSLGVVQGTGSKLDILAAEIRLLHDILEKKKKGL
jgi:hypothetical protein